ncbi:MAG TPA: hypothetical protein VD833_15355 [Vicinamibacterales bacterium]|nr:hypothetical protein [Vicinamibacterales bacterium]
MGLREAVLLALENQFGQGRFTAGAGDNPIAVFRAANPQVGDAVVVAGVETPHTLTVTVTVGEVLADSFDNFDSHLPPRARAARLTSDLVWFLDRLFADRLLFWKSTDGLRAGWRDRGDVGHLEPLVLDNRPYGRYLWSGPLSLWQAGPSILGRGMIRDEREYQILRVAVDDPGDNPLEQPELERARQLLAEYDRNPPP